MLVIGSCIQTNFMPYQPGNIKFSKHFWGHKINESSWWGGVGGLIVSGLYRNCGCIIMRNSIIHIIIFIILSLQIECISLKHIKRFRNSHLSSEI